MNAEIKQLAARQAAICRVFSNPRRILILWLLVDQERSVGEIALAIDASLQNTSQHLRLMKKRGILDSRREAQTIYYSICDNEAPETCCLLFEFRRQLRTDEVMA